MPSVVPATCLPATFHAALKYLYTRDRGGNGTEMHVTWAPLFPVAQASKVRTVLACWRLGGRAPYQFSSLGPALSFHHHDTADQVPLCPRPVASRPCRILCFDSRHSLWARGCLLLFVARPSPSCRSCEDPSPSSIEPPERRKARVASPAPLPRRSQLSRPIATAPVESLTRVPNEWGPESVFHLGIPTSQTLQDGRILPVPVPCDPFAVSASTAGCHFASPRPASVDLTGLFIAIAGNDRN